MRHCDIHDGVIVSWDENVKTGTRNVCPLCNMTDLYRDMANDAIKLEAVVSEKDEQIEDLKEKIRILEAFEASAREALTPKDENDNKA